MRPCTEAVEKLKTTLKVCGTFKSYYFDYKSKTQQETPDNPWRQGSTQHQSQSHTFSHLNLCRRRCVLSTTLKLSPPKALSS